MRDAYSPAVAPVTPAEARTLAQVQAELARLIRYDDESIVHEAWIRQRYQGGFAASYAPARSAAVHTAWHEAGHAVAALAVGARFSSASIRAGGSTSGRVHSIQGGGELSFVIDAAGQVAERLRDWTGAYPSSMSRLRPSRSTKPPSRNVCSYGSPASSGCWRSV